MAKYKTTYEYKAFVTEVIDGDTIGCRVDLGFGVEFRDRFRLFRINAPEVRGHEKPEGLATKNWLVERILAKDVKIKTHKDLRRNKDEQGKYGRYLAEVMHDGVNVGDLMVSMGLAREVDY